MTKQRKVYHIEYRHDHKLAKFIVVVIQVILTVIAIYLLEGVFQFVACLFLVKEVLYYFGVNPVQYIIEAIYHHKHKVTKL